MRSNTQLLVIILTSLLLTACGGDKTTKEVATAPDQSGLIISVENGLSAEFAQGDVTLNAISNTVATDTTFTYTETAASSTDMEQGIVSSIHTFRPNNLIFAEPLSLAIKLPDEQTNLAFSIVQLVDEQWQTLSTEQSDDGFAVSAITEFGSFALMSRTIPAASKTIGEQCNDTASNQTVRFIHVADLHARFGFKEQLFSRIRSYYDNAKLENPNTLFTNGGDDYEKGTVAEQTSQGLATVEAIKAMAFDVRVIGNHDYAWGPEQLLDFADDDNAIVLSSNTDYDGNSETPFAGVDFSVVQVGCLRIGFFGMTSVPWNELDEPVEDEPIPDFIANFKMNWQWQEVAEQIVNQYRQDVDYMVMVSHLGEGTDTRIAQNVAGIDLVLGGHTHGGESYQTLDNGSIVIQPNFFAQGLTDLTLTFNLEDKTLADVGYNTVPTTSITTRDESTKTAIDEIMGRYAPDANTEIAVSENYPTAEELATITAKATMQQFPAIDAALLDASQVQDRWLPGTLTQEDFHAAFKVERQPSNTPGFNSIYQVSVTGSQLKRMLESQPEWVSLVPDNIDDASTYLVALFKGPALNSKLFFPALPNLEAQLVAESWWLLDNYARARTSQCLYIDTDNILNACKADDAVTVWNFNNPEQGFSSDFGPATLSFYDPEYKNWGPEDSQFATTSELEIADFTNGASGVLAFARHSPTQGLTLTANSAANGDYQTKGLIADYTLVMDIMWPEQSTNEWRSLLQTDLTNNNDADLYVSRNNAIGIATSDSGYFGELLANSWHRIAFVFYAAPNNGALKIYLDGELIGIKDEGEINERWAINDAALLLTDNDYETKPGYLNALLFAGRAMTDAEIANMGAAQQQLNFTQSTRTLNQVVERHYQAAPQIMNNPWLQQRSKFFNKERQFLH